MVLMWKETPIGRLGLLEREKKLAAILLPGTAPPAGVREGESPLLHTVSAQLDQYFAGERDTFDLPLALDGTPFQQGVWRALCDIPYGETRSYAQVAAAVGNPKACRAVGFANNRNRLPIVIPCHRVVGADGRLVGYAGGVDVKQTLLDLEQGTLPR